MQQLAELCELLIENSFGIVAARIFSVLAKHGRLPLHTLRQHTSTHLRRLKVALFILVQHHVVLHHSAEEDEPTFFQIDWHAAYVLVRSDKITQLVVERHGEEAGDMIEQILQLGHASVGDLVNELELTLSKSGAKNKGMVNGQANDKGTHEHNEIDDNQGMSVTKLHETLATLLKFGFLTKVNQRAFMPQADLEQRIGDKVMAEYFPEGKATGPKKQQEFKMQVNRMKRKWQQEDEYSSFRDLASSGTMDSSSGNKRAKLNNGTSNGVNGSQARAVQKLSNDLIVRINFVKCTFALRGQRLERLVTKYLGSTTATIYSALLRATEDKSKILRQEVKVTSSADSDDEEEALPGVTDMEVLDYMDNSIDLSSSIQGAGQSRKRGTYEEDAALLGIKQEDSGSEDDEPDPDGQMTFKQRARRLGQVEIHLQLLAESSKNFCTRKGTHKESKINFNALTDLLVQAEIDTMIHARFGVDAARLGRMLRAMGKLEERQIAQLTMMRIRDIRAALTALQFHGFAEAQELPKDNTRQPSRTVYLWYFDQKRAQAVYLETAYQAMTRTLQRLRVERGAKYRGVIEKAERTDVRGREQELLTGPEKNLLREWREVEERLMVQVARLDDVITVLRDFSGKDITMIS